MDSLPANCRAEDRRLWRTTAPLIHFWIVEMHNPGRVARQFDRYQRIPPYLRDTQESLHILINGMGANWPSKHKKYLQLWDLRRHLCSKDPRPYDHSRREEYMTWFSSSSILYLSTSGGVPNPSRLAERITRLAMSMVERLGDMADEDSRAFVRQQLDNFRSTIKNLLDAQQPQRQEVRPVLNGGSGLPHRAPTKRARGSASTSR